MSLGGDCHAGAPGQRQVVSLFGWVRGDVRLVLSCAVMSMYVFKDDKEMFFRRQSSGTYDFWVFFICPVSCKGNAVLGRLGKRGSFGSSVISSPNRPP